MYNYAFIYTDIYLYVCAYTYTFYTYIMLLHLIFHFGKSKAFLAFEKQSGTTLVHEKEEKKK